MANKLERQIILDGPKRAVVKMVLLSDGVTGDAADALAVDLSELSGSPTALTVMRVQFSSVGASALLEFDTTAGDPEDDGPFVLIPQDTVGEFDFREFGGCQSNAGTNNGSIITGDIAITTTGMATAGDGFSIVFELKKEF